MIYCIQGSCDTTQPMNNMDTSRVSNVDNPPLSSAKPFHFTASMETHSTTPTANSDTSANITSTEGGLASKVDDLPSPEDSTTLGDTPPIKSTSEPHYTVKPMPADKIYDDDDGSDDVFEHDETSPLIGTEKHRQPNARKNLRSRHIVESGCSYNLIEDTQPLLDEEEEGKDTGPSKTTSSSWFCNFSVRSVISYLINLGSNIGNSLLCCISEIFCPHAEPTEPTNIESVDTHNNHIN